MSNNPSSEINFGDYIHQSPYPHTTTYNTDIHTIVINEDRARLLLNDQVDELKQIVEKREKWKTPLGIFITIFVVFPTCEFKDFVFIKEFWMGTFIFFAIVSLFFTGLFGYRACKTRKICERNIIDKIISEFSQEQRGSQPTTSQEST